MSAVALIVQSAVRIKIQMVFNESSEKVHRLGAKSVFEADVSSPGNYIAAQRHVDPTCGA